MCVEKAFATSSKQTYSAASETPKASLLGLWWGDPCELLPQVETMLRRGVLPWPKVPDLVCSFASRVARLQRDWEINGG